LTTAVKRWECLEAGCSFSVVAANDEELIEKANEHVGQAHDSYELEDVILAGAVEVPGPGG
jgi:predicted small metal-binding protein